jgi:DNA repair photolyase
MGNRIKFKKQMLIELEVELEQSILSGEVPQFELKSLSVRSVEDEKVSDSLPTIHRKSLLNSTKVDYGDFCINHVRGCAHGCRFPCYAMNLDKRYKRIKDYEDWRKPRLVGNAMELLDKEIPKCKGKVHFVHLSFMTDPFMYDASHNRGFEEIKDLTLKIIAKLHMHGIKVTTLTKGIHPEELADTKTYGKQNEYGITLVSLDPDFLREYEPFAAPIHDRIKALKTLQEGGLKTWVSVEPYPTPNLVAQDLGKILREISFAETIIFGQMNYNKDVSAYAEKDDFYRRCVNQVTDFCRKRNIRSYIKKGTPGAQKGCQQGLFR